MKVLTDNQHYQDIAEAILAKTGGTTPLKPAEMAPALNDLNIELEEALVTPTSEPQEILPGEGFYGFSKIIVDGVEGGGDSGGGGTGGGTGGETGDDTGGDETGPKGNAEDLSFDLSVEKSYCLATGEVSTGSRYSSNSMQANGYTPTQDIILSGVRIYISSAGLPEGKIAVWDWSTKEVISEIEIPAPSGKSRWVAYSIPPVTLKSGKTYLIGFYSVASFRLSYFSSCTWNYVSCDNNYYYYSYSGFNFPQMSASGKPYAIDLLKGTSTSDVTDDTYVIKYTTLEQLAQEVERITGVNNVQTVGQMVSLLQTVPSMVTE